MTDFTARSNNRWCKTWLNASLEGGGAAAFNCNKFTHK